MDINSNVEVEKVSHTHLPNFIFSLPEPSLYTYNKFQINMDDSQQSLIFNGSNDSIETLYTGYDNNYASLSNETFYTSSDTLTDRLSNVNTPTPNNSRYIYDSGLYISNIQRRKSISNTYIKRAQFYKTKICLWHLNGRCFMGDGCNYAHSFSELKENPDLKKTSLCIEMKQRLTCTNPTCQYAHSQKELRANNFLFKTSICKFWKYGRCPSGSTCRYAHGLEEVRNPLEPFPSPLYGIDNNNEFTMS